MLKLPTNKYLVPIVFIMTLFCGGNAFGLSDEIENILLSNDPQLIAKRIIEECNPSFKGERFFVTRAQRVNSNLQRVIELGAPIHRSVQLNRSNLILSVAFMRLNYSEDQYHQNILRFFRTSLQQHAAPIAIDHEIYDAIITEDLLYLCNLLSREKYGGFFITGLSAADLSLGVFQQYKSYLNNLQILQDIENNNIEGYYLNPRALDAIIALLESMREGENNQLTQDYDSMLRWFRSIRSRRETRRSRWIEMTNQMRTNQHAPYFAVDFASMYKTDNANNLPLDTLNGDLGDIIVAEIGAFLTGPSGK